MTQSSITWSQELAAYDTLTLRSHGDPVEKRGAIEFGLDGPFPNYEAFWRRHICPATERPGSTYLRASASEEVKAVAQISHGIFNDLVRSAAELASITGDDLSDGQYDHCWNSIKENGNAIQKFTSLQEAIEGPIKKNGDWANTRSISRALNKPGLKFRNSPQWKALFTRRDPAIGYRNYLTHQGLPPITTTKDAIGLSVPHVLDRAHLVKKSDILWDSPTYDFLAMPNAWRPLTDVCAELHKEAIAWLNDCYACVTGLLDPLIFNRDYQQLWGWDASSGPAVKPSQINSPMNMAAMSGVRLG